MSDDRNPYRPPYRQQDQEPGRQQLQEIDDAIDDERPPTAPVEPLRFLSLLMQWQEIDGAERDAGEIFHRIARVSMSELPARTRHDVPWKSAEGKWSRKTLTRAEAKTLLDVALVAIRFDNRRKVVMLALAAREPSIEWAKLPMLVAGLEDLSRNWIGGQQPKPTFVNRHGVTMPKTLGDNDATEQRLDHVANDDDLGVVDGARRINDWPFERMWRRGQLDENPEDNDLLHAAGLRLSQDWHRAGISGIATVNLARTRVDGGRPGGTVPEQRLERLQSLNKARAALDARHWAIVVAVVVEGKTLTEASAICADNTRTAKVLGAERLNVGLRRLAAFYGLTRSAA